MNRGQVIAGWIRGFVGLLVEVEAGVRPVRHIRPMLAPSLQARVGNAGRAGTIPKVGRILLQTSARSCEAVVLLHADGQTTAITLTLGRDKDGWLISDLGRPEDRQMETLTDEEPPLQEDVLAQLAWHRDPVESRAPSWSMPDGWLRHEQTTYDTAA